MPCIKEVVRCRDLNQIVQRCYSSCTNTFIGRGRAYCSRVCKGWELLSDRELDVEGASVLTSRNLCYGLCGSEALGAYVDRTEWSVLRFM